MLMSLFGISLDKSWHTQGSERCMWHGPHGVLLALIFTRPQTSQERTEWDRVKHGCIDPSVFSSDASCVFLSALSVALSSNSVQTLNRVLLRKSRCACRVQSTKNPASLHVCQAPNAGHVTKHGYGVFLSVMVLVFG